MMEGESTNESSRRFPFRAVLAVSDGLLSLTCLLVLGILLGMLPFLNLLSTSYNLAPLMNASALISGLLVPALTFMASAIMLPQKVALSRIGAKIGALSNAVLLPVVIAIYWLARMHPYVPVPSAGIKIAFALYIVMSVILLALHGWYLVRTRKDTMRGATRGYAFLLVLVAIDAVIIGAFILHLSALQSGPSLAEYGQNWISAIAYRLLYDGDGLTLGYAFQALALLIATILLVTGRRQYVLMGSICAIAGYASMLLPLVLTYREALKYDPFSFDRTPPPPNIGIDAGFVAEATAIAGCLLILHIIALVLSFKPPKATQTKGAHSKDAAHEAMVGAKVETPEENVRTTDRPQEDPVGVDPRNGRFVILSTLCVALIIAFVSSFLAPLVNPEASNASPWNAIFWAFPLSCTIFIIALIIDRAKRPGSFKAMRALERLTLVFYCYYAIMSGYALLIMAAFANSMLVISFVILLTLAQVIMAVMLMHLAGSAGLAKKMQRTGLYAALIVMLFPTFLITWVPILSVLAQGYDPADYSYLVDGRFTASLGPLLLMVDFIIFAAWKRPTEGQASERSAKKRTDIARRLAWIDEHILIVLFAASVVLAVPFSFIPQLSSYYGSGSNIAEAFLNASSIVLLFANMVYFFAAPSRSAGFAAARKVEAATVAIGALTAISLRNYAGFLWYFLSPDRSDPDPLPVCVGMIVLVILTTLYIRVLMENSGPRTNLILLLLLVCLAAYLWMYLPSLYASLYCGIASYGFIAVKLIRNMRGTNDIERLKHIRPKQEQEKLTRATQGRFSCYIHRCRQTRVHGETVCERKINEGGLSVDR